MSALPAKRSWLQYFTAALVLLGSIGLLVQGWRLLQPQINQQVNHILVQGDLSAYNQRQLEEQVAGFLHQGFLELELDQMQLALAQLPWVSQVQVSRVWPDQLLIEVAEHIPVARWGENFLLNVQADVFSNQGMRNFAGLPLLSGPADSQVQVMEQYWKLSQILRPLGYSISQLEMRERGSWFVTTSSGLRLLLGREEVMEKMRRFVTIYEKELKTQMEQIAQIDLRYSNGLAVTWHDAVAQQEQ